MGLESKPDFKWRSHLQTRTSTLELGVLTLLVVDISRPKAVLLCLVIILSLECGF